MQKHLNSSLKLVNLNYRYNNITTISYKSFRCKAVSGSSFQTRAVYLKASHESCHHTMTSTPSFSYIIK